MASLEEESMFDHWSDFFGDDNINLLSSITNTIDESNQKIQPSKDEVLQMFVMIPPEKVRVIIVGQSPYPDDNACGIPFLSKRNIVPKSLANIKKEVELEFKVQIGDPNRMILSWIEQGAFLINCSLTIGVTGEKYLQDHSILWKEFIINLMRFIGSRNIPILLFGKEAWNMEEYFKSDFVLKVPHPVSRGNKEFIGCNVFSRANDIADSANIERINWTKN